MSMNKEIERLKAQSQSISQQIYALQDQIKFSPDFKLIEAKKSLQYQALFCLEKIHNLEQQKRSLIFIYYVFFNDRLLRKKSY